MTLLKKNFFWETFQWTKEGFSEQFFMEPYLPLKITIKCNECRLLRFRLIYKYLDDDGDDEEEEDYDEALTPSYYYDNILYENMQDIHSLFFKWPTDLWMAVRLSFCSWIIHILWWVMLWSLPFSHSRSSVIIKAQCEVHRFIQYGYNFSSIHVCEVRMRKNENDGENERESE